MQPVVNRSLQSWGITVLRLLVGAVFLMHGSQKLFVIGVASVAAMFGKMGLPWPMASASLSTAAEFGCGLLLVLGLFTRWATVPLIINMLVAIVHVHLRNGFFLTNNPPGFEYALTLLVANVALLLLGSGELALDNLRGRRRIAPPAATAQPA